MLAETIQYYTIVQVQKKFEWRPLDIYFGCTLGRGSIVIVICHLDIHIPKQQILCIVLLRALNYVQEFDALDGPFSKKKLAIKVSSLWSLEPLLVPGGTLSELYHVIYVKTQNIAKLLFPSASVCIM